MHYTRSGEVIKIESLIKSSMSPNPTLHAQGHMSVYNYPNQLQLEIHNQNHVPFISHNFKVMPFCWIHLVQINDQVISALFPPCTLRIGMHSFLNFSLSHHHTTLALTFSIRYVKTFPAWPIFDPIFLVENTATLPSMPMVL